MVFPVAGTLQTFNKRPRGLKTLQRYNMPLFLRGRRKDKRFHVPNIDTVPKCPETAYTKGQDTIEAR
jgi:hypothetical protein